eukprot:6909923-Pyramimonas_sp.AAC.1
MLGSEVVRSLGSFKEKSRYKAGTPAIRARDHALLGTDVFSSINAVKPVDPVEAPEVWDENHPIFTEIPQELLDPKDWQLDFAARFLEVENIM